MRLDSDGVDDEVLDRKCCLVDVEVESRQHDSQKRAAVESVATEGAVFIMNRIRGRGARGVVGR